MIHYLLFGFEVSYPNGGWNDFIQRFNTKEEALEYLKRLSLEDTRQDFFQVVCIAGNTVMKKVLVANWERVGGVRKRDGKLTIIESS